MTSAEIVVEFIRGRPALEAAVRKITGDPYRAPEIISTLVQEEVLCSLDDVSDEERAKLDAMRGRGDVDWAEVARAFGARGATE
jgi:hypothetical protein